MARRKRVTTGQLVCALSFCALGLLFTAGCFYYALVIMPDDSHIAAAQRVVRGGVKYPLDTTFPDRPKVREVKDGVFRVSGKVKTRNGYGNPITLAYVVEVNKGGMAKIVKLTDYSAQ